MVDVRNALSSAIAENTYLRLDAANDPMTAALDMGNNNISNVATITATTLTDGTFSVTGGTINASTVLADGVTATTQSNDDNSTKVATTAYVDNMILTEDFWDRVGDDLSPKNAGDDIMKNTTGDIGSTGSRWDNIWGTSIVGTTIGDGTITITTGALAGLNSFNGSATDITGAEMETLTDTSNADALHDHTQASVTVDRLTSTNSTLILSDDTTDATLTGNLGDLNIVSATDIILDPASNNVIIDGTAPSLTFADNTENYSLTVDANSLTILNTTGYTNGNIVLDHPISLTPSAPNTAAFGQKWSMLSAPTLTVAAVSNYSILSEQGTYTLNGTISSFSIINALGTVENINALTGAAYLFVSNMVSFSDTAAAAPPAYRSFDHRGRIRADGAATGTSQHNIALFDIGAVEAINSGSLTVTDWFVASNSSIGTLGVVSATAGASATVTNRVGFNYVNTLLAGAGGTEVISSTGGALWLGDGQDATFYYDGTNMILDPDVVGSGIVLIGATGDDDMRLTNIEIDGALNHDGSTVGFYGTAPVVQSAAYTPTNVTTDRAYDANATTIDEIADVLGTLIADLQATGLIG
jgi:hypothetical protein